MDPFRCRILFSCSYFGQQGLAMLLFSGIQWPRWSAELKNPIHTVCTVQHKQHKQQTSNAISAIIHLPQLPQSTCGLLLSVLPLASSAPPSSQSMFSFLAPPPTSSPARAAWTPRLSALIPPTPGATLLATTLLKSTRITAKSVDAPNQPQPISEPTHQP